MAEKQAETVELLRLRAADEASVEVLSECLFEAVVLPAGMQFDRTAGRFVMAFERFTWEASGGDDSRLLQVPCRLVVDHVTRVAQTGLGASARERIFSVSSLTYEAGTLLVVLAEGAAIRLDVAKIACHLEDLGPGRPPPVVPGHRHGLA